MSQFRRQIDLIEREAGLDGLVVRPLSARLFPPTIPEKMGMDQPGENAGYSRTLHEAADSSR